MDILIEGLTKRYGAQKAVDNISFEVNTGEIVGAPGPNGAGKTANGNLINDTIEGKRIIFNDLQWSYDQP